MKDITHIFFDLDHTLWDYDYNSRKVLLDLYEHFELSKVTNAVPEGFLTAFYSVNATLWDLYNTGKAGRDTIRNSRFPMVLKSCGKDDEELGNRLSEYFLHHCPRQPKIIEEADILLNYLQGRYHLSIITNGFDDVQFVKLKSCKLDGYFTHVFTSETIGVKKPDAGIFEHALGVLRVDRSKVLMIGDNPKTDILGARNAGIVPVLFNPKGNAKSDCEYEVSRLSELMKIL